MSQILVTESSTYKTNDIFHTEVLNLLPWFAQIFLHGFQFDS